MQPDKAPRRGCRACGGAMRFSHTVYAGRGDEAAVHVCTLCGTAAKGPSRSVAERRPQPRREHDQRPGRRPLEEGSPENPVIDGDAARRLREQLGLE